MIPHRWQQEVSTFHKREGCAEEDERQYLREQMTEKVIDEDKSFLCKNDFINRFYIFYKYKFLF